MSQPGEPARREQGPSSDHDPDETRVLPAVDEPAPARRRRPGRVVALVLGGIAVLAAGAYGIGYAMAGDRLPANAVVAGVAVGGLSPDAATEKLRQELQPRATAPVPLEIDGKRVQLDPAAAGLSVDYDASIRAAGGGRSADPRQIYRVLTGGSATGAVAAVDRARLDTAVAGLATTYDRKPADAKLSYDGTEVVARNATTGLTVDRSGTADAIGAAYPTDRPITAAVAVAEPEITTAELRTVVRDVARPAVAAPVVVKAGQAGSFRLTPADLAGAISFGPADGTLALRLDAGRLRTTAADAIDDLDLAAHRDATVRLVDGKPRVIPSADGTKVTADNLAAAVRPALTLTGDERTVSVKLSGAKASFTTADAEKLRIKEVTGKFTTYFPYATYRNVNISRAAEKINGTVLKPGQTFSLNTIVGERTKANGFVEGYIISGGKFKKEYGGGVSQSATTTFNAMFFAGLQDVQHQPHTLFINRYPAGREATVAWPTLDLKFRNNTDHGVLVEASVTKATPGNRGSITVKMWSTKTWQKVTSTELVRSGYTTGRDLTDDSPSCEAQAPVPGFTVNYSRLFYRGGEVVKQEPFRWSYAPTDRIVCR